MTETYIAILSDPQPAVKLIILSNPMQASVVQLWLVSCTGSLLFLASFLLTNGESKLLFDAILSRSIMVGAQILFEQFSTALVVLAQCFTTNTRLQSYKGENKNEQ